MISKMTNWLKLKISSIYLLIHLKRPFKTYKIILVKNQSLLQEVYKLRFRQYCLVDKLLDPADYKNGLEKDGYDDNSVQFVVTDKRNELVGTFRLIKPSTEYLFPTEEEFKLRSLLNNHTRQKTVEISRFMVRKDHRKTMLLLDMLKTIYQFSKEQGIEYWHGCAETWFINTLDYILGPLSVIKKPHFTFNAINYPFLFSVQDIEKNVKKRGSFLFTYFTSQSSNIFTK